MHEISTLDNLEFEELIETQKGKEMIKAKQEQRPYVLSSRVYKLKSVFVDYAIYITLSYIEEEDGTKRPHEIFINSKDLSRAAEYTVLTRLISAIFRRSENPTFIIEELKSIYDPNGGRFKDGKYIASIYAEIAYVLEDFFAELGLLKKKEPVSTTLLTFAYPNIFEGKKEEKDVNLSLKICPKCNQKTLKVENACLTCVNTECNYSKCD
ncbi:MAG: hypothetical protein QW035_00335 [Candidatus Anstonellales archaeon]